MTCTNLTRALTAIASVAAMQWVSAQQPIQSPVDRVRNLYESAAYDDALATIDRIVALPPTAGSLSESAVLLRYRALCLLALDRGPEAEGAVEQLLIQDPVYSEEAVDTSPRFVSVLNRTRNRVLPQLVQRQYDEAKRNFDQRRLQEAATGFARVVALIDNPTLGQSALASSRDLRTLAVGFLELSRAGTAPPQQTPASAPANGRASSDAPPPQRIAVSEPESGRIYSAADRDVTPPVTVRQELPAWRAGAMGFSGRFEGQLDIVINETGGVESATLAKSIFPAYDELATAGSKDWKYRPAMRNGVPVKFRKPVLIRLNINQ